MRLTRRKKGQRSDFDIVVTSMLDINFLLIMFFMITAQFQRTTHAKLSLPLEKGEAHAQVDEAGLVINVTKNGEIIVSSQTVAFDELRKMVKEKVEGLGSNSASPLKLMVRADRDATTKDLNRVVTMLREMGVGTIRIATEVPL